MREERLKKIQEILSNYSKVSDVVDYYQLFQLDPSMSIEEITKYLKEMRLQVLFHPDQINYIPTEYREKYQQMISEMNEISNTFSDATHKRIYDQKLREAKRKEEEKNRAYSDKQTSQEEETLDLDEERIEYAIINNVQKYGFKQTMYAFNILLSENNPFGFTKDNEVRSTIKMVSPQKIMSIFMESCIDESSFSIDSIIMNYFTDFIYNHEEYKTQIDALEHACATTLQKYDMNGYYGQTAGALNKYCNTGDVGGFTSKNAARSNLEQNGNWKEADFLIQCALNKRRNLDSRFNYNYTKGMSINNLNQMYCGQLYQEILNNEYSTEGSYGGK